MDSPAPRFLTRRELRTVRKFAEVAIEGRGEALTAAEVAGNIDRHLGRISSGRTAGIRLALAAIEFLLPWLALRPRFSWMGYNRRRELVDRCVARPRGPLGRYLLRDLARIKVMFLVGYYGDERAQRDIGYVPVAERERYEDGDLVDLGRPPIPLHEPSGPTERCEVCVIGSGAAGAIVAANAAEAGHDVLVVEEGPYLHGLAGISHDESEMTARLYRDGGLQTTVDLDMAIQQGSCLGGSSFINNAICLRLDDPALTPRPPGTPGVLDRWREFGANIDPDKLGESFDRVGERIGVGPLLDVQDPGVPPIDGANAAALLDGWAALVADGAVSPDIRSGLFRKNYERCLGCGHCFLGCRYERKLSVAETYLPDAAAAGARIVVDCRVERIETSGRRAVRVHAARNGRPHVIEAERVVICAGAIGSSLLLKRSGIHRNVGSRFSFNANTTLLARFPDDHPIRGWDGVMMPAYVDAGPYILESYFSPPMAFSALVSGWFGTHFQRMRDYNRYACAGVVIGTEPNARVKRYEVFRNLRGPVKYRMTDGDLANLRAGMSRLAQTFFAAGAEAVLPSSFTHDWELPAERYAGDPAAIERFFDDNVRRPDDVSLNSAHPQGGNPMSDDPRRGVVDSHFRVHGFDNLFVCDASVFPSGVGINPQWCVMAMADRLRRVGTVRSEPAA